jgi:hypothetical protein
MAQIPILVIPSLTESLAFGLTVAICGAREGRGVWAHPQQRRCAAS